MNLTPLFEVQRKLDDKIIEEKGLEGQDLLPEKVLALLVELGELANEWRGFKFWSKNRKANTQEFRLLQVFEDDHGPSFETINPLLEEYVDCLHFILSIGIECEIKQFEPWSHTDTTDTTHQFIAVYRTVETIALMVQINFEDKQDAYEALFAHFMTLGEMLGFTWDQVESAYMEKNRVNHQRQDNGY